MLISPEYRDLNEKLHESHLSYGTSGKKYADLILTTMDLMNVESVLDYGCGKHSLRDALEEERPASAAKLREYDPCVPGYDGTPQPAELVICTDVLEHIEPDCLDDVLDDLRRCTLKRCMLIIATVRAKKTLADGRNAHLIVRPVPWWLPRLWSRWKIMRFIDLGNEFLFEGKC